jgi:pantoate--beta-alanine ligase
MELIRDPASLRTLTDAARARDRTVGLVPTMGALHAGHESLIDLAGAAAGDGAPATGFVVVSIFVNPLQFVAGEDFERYPRDEIADLAMCEALGVDAVWAPEIDQMFPPGVELPEPDPGPAGERFEGASRPGHFAGVLKAVRRLLDVTGPCDAYFGEKDAQQLFLVRRMVQRLEFPVRVRVCPTVREPDGLASSSRNAYLSSEARGEAGCLFLGLSEAAALARAGERDAHRLVAAIAREVGAARQARLDYAAVVDDATFEPIDQVQSGAEARALVAASFGGVRLIDNLRLPRLSPGERVGDDGPSAIDAGGDEGI